MKTLKSLPLILFATISLLSCNAQKQENQKTDSRISEDVQVYYFHNTRRCATCNAVENETKVALEMYYNDMMSAGTIEFNSLNLEEKEGKELAGTLHVSGQTLLLVKGDTRVNLTNEGFLNARTHPTKFHEILKTHIDKLL